MCISSRFALNTYLVRDTSALARTRQTGAASGRHGYAVEVSPYTLSSCSRSSRTRMAATAGETVQTVGCGGCSGALAEKVSVTLLMCVPD